MNHVVSLVEALRPRACNVAEEVSGRIRDPGLWAGYRASEGLVGELRLSTLLVYHRPGQPMAVLVFRMPRMTGLRQVHWGEPIVLEADVEDRYASHILIDEPVVYSKEISHTFAKVQTLLQQIKAGLEASLKVGGEAGVSGGIHGVTAKVYAELMVKLSAEYQRQWGEQTTESNTVTDKFQRTVTAKELESGPVRVDYEAVRSRNREQRVIRADCDYEHTIELIDETGAGENPPRIQMIVESWAQMRQVMQGFAPRHREVERDGRKELVETGFYDEFIRNPLRGDRLEALSAPAAGAIELLVEYDDVLKQTINIL